MEKYKLNEARAWAKETVIGCSSVTIPSFSGDLKKLNEAGIRHDIALSMKLGFSATLLCSEIPISAEENATFTSWARDTAGEKLLLFFHASFGTLADNIEAATMAEKAGADIVLLSYPTQFRPNSEQEIYDYTKSFCGSVGMPVMLFAIPTWGFERVHPAGMSTGLVRRLLDDCPNIVAIKAEQGYPLPAGICEMYHHFRDEVVISCPIEGDVIPLMSVMRLQFSGTSNTQWMSDYFPKAFELARAGRWEEAMKLYWKVNPARSANTAVTQSYLSATGALNRSLWKYQDWLAGFNGGPLRAPTFRVADRVMTQLRQSLVAAGLPVTSDPDSQYLIGRNPV